MAMDLTKDPDFSALFEKLLEKTVAGKLEWQETAVEDTFLAAAKGIQTFEIALVDQALKFGAFSASGKTKAVVLKVKDKDGKLVLKHVERVQDSPAFDLFQVARRVAMRVDEKIESSLEVLESLG